MEPISKRSLAILLLLVASYGNATKFELCDMAEDQFRHHCLNAGICYNLVGAAAEAENVQTIFCSCPAEFTGKRCEERLVRPDFIPFMKLNEMPGLLEKLQKEASNIVFQTVPETTRRQRSVGRSIGKHGSEFCSNVGCPTGHICKYFDSNMYKCPEDRMDCQPYRTASRIPICVSNNFHEVCLDSLKMGNCSTYRERYYFDLVDKTCKKFYYTGCNGNRNNFGSLEECSSSCSTQPELIPESLPRVSPEETSLDLSSDDERATNKCEFSCALNCPFGYRLNYRTNCPICECSMLRMTECGVPCFAAGARSCSFAMRANSRPNCECNPSYEGVYCHIYTKNANFTVELDQRLYLNEPIKNEIRMNLREKLSDILVVGRKSVEVREVLNDLSGKVIIRFNVRPADFSTPNEFENMVNWLRYAINDKLKLTIRNTNYTISQNCVLNEETFQLQLNNAYLIHKSDKFAQLTKYLRDILVNEYKFKPDSIITVAVNPEDAIQIELRIKNTPNDIYFCEKAYLLQRDIRLNLFNLSYMSNQLLDKSTRQKLQKEITILSNNSLVVNTDMSAVATKDELIDVGQFTSTTQLNPSFVFVTVTLTCFLILIFSIGLIVIAHVKRKQDRDQSKLNEIYGQRIYDNIERRKSTQNEFVGYFLPNYASTSQMNLIL